MVASAHILNITNGDNAVAMMKQAKITGDFLPWRDVLHEGPVPNDLSLEALSVIRAAFITDQGWGNPQDIKQHFKERDQQLKRAHEYDEVILWFEHDLYDQLQLIQILDWFYQHQPNVPLSIICVDQYLGRLSPNDMRALQAVKTSVSDDQLKIAHEAWFAFRQKTPHDLQAFLRRDTSVLPFLKGAIERLLEEYPSTVNGLSRTEAQALRVIAKGEIGAWQVFELNQKAEERVFLGDLIFWEILDRFMMADKPLITLFGQHQSLSSRKDQRFTITPTGLAVLSGKINGLDILGLHRHIGGVYLTAENLWYWDAKEKRILAG